MSECWTVDPSPFQAGQHSSSRAPGRQGPWVWSSSRAPGGQGPMHVLGMPRCVYVALEAGRPAVFGSQVSPKWLLRKEGTLSCQGEAGRQKAGGLRAHLPSDSHLGGCVSSLFYGYCSTLAEECTEQVCRLLYYHGVDTWVTTEVRGRALTLAPFSSSGGSPLALILALPFGTSMSKNHRLVRSGFFFLLTKMAPCRTASFVWDCFRSALLCELHGGCM